MAAGAVATLVLVLIPVSTARGVNYYGSRYLNATCCTLYGGRANIDQATLSPGTTISLARVEADNAGAYLVQSGLIKGVTSGSWANCPDVLSRSRFFEALTPSGTFCNKFANQSLTRAAVLWSTQGSTQWSAWLDGSMVFLGNVGFGAASGFLAGGEIGPPSGSNTARYGAGDTPWQRATQRGGGAYFTIQQSFTNSNPPGGWVIGPLPSPFTIHRP